MPTAGKGTTALGLGKYFCVGLDDRRHSFPPKVGIISLLTQHRPLADTMDELSKRHKRCIDMRGSERLQQSRHRHWPEMHSTTY
ncbi:hypothetical protein OUZ56_027925 [Daphnia magna]|uniref:Uncharacterized protein n=1 Tax=Daphnia magna TaxID=35525 RepID=A0ABR0B2C1_9CRUS|nr:hypothetical protein OUZ56_027925 [Daphnia magna]